MNIEMLDKLCYHYFDHNKPVELYPMNGSGCPYYKPNSEVIGVVVKIKEVKIMGVDFEKNDNYEYITTYIKLHNYSEYIQIPNSNLVKK